MGNVHFIGGLSQEEDVARSDVMSLVASEFARDPKQQRSKVLLVCLKSQACQALTTPSLLRKVRVDTTKPLLSVVQHSLRIRFVQALYEWLGVSFKCKDSRSFSKNVVMPLFKGTGAEAWYIKKIQHIGYQYKENTLVMSRGWLRGGQGSVSDVLVDLACKGVQPLPLPDVFPADVRAREAVAAFHAVVQHVTYHDVVDMEQVKGLLRQAQENKHAVHRSLTPSHCGHCNIQLAIASYKVRGYVMCIVVVCS